MKEGVNVNKKIVLLGVGAIMLIMSGILVNMIVNTYNDDEHMELVKFHDQIYFVSGSATEGDYTLKEEIGVVKYWDSEFPERDFSSNSYGLKKGEIYTVLERDDVYVIPFVDSDYTTKYHVLEVFKD